MYRIYTYICLKCAQFLKINAGNSLSDGDPTLITHRDLQKVYILNKYHFSTCIYYKETMKILVTHIN